MASNAYDIVTIGGGLGGSALAKAMAEHGARVLVLGGSTTLSWPPEPTSCPGGTTTRGRSGPAIATSSILPP